jgi:hypothetical protein
MPIADPRLTSLELDVRQVETLLAAGYYFPDLILERILTVFTTPARSTRAPIWGKESFEYVNPRRALHATPELVSFGYEFTDISLAEYTLAVPQDVREARASAEIGLSFGDQARRLAKRLVSLGREVDGATLLLSTGTYPVGSSETVSAGNRWDVQTTPGTNDTDPIDVILNRMDVVKSKIGRKPNKLMLSYDAWALGFRENSNVKSRLFVNTPNPQRGKVMVENVRELLELDEIIIGDSVYWDGANWVDIWGQNAILFYSVPPAEEGTPTFGRTLSHQYGEVDGIPLLGISGVWEENSWVTYDWYSEERTAWISLADAGYLMLQVVGT